MVFQVVYVVFSNFEEARKIASNVVSAKLAACANIFQEHQAIYEWNGEICEASEVAVIFKTTADRYKALEREILEMHSYDEPCVLALPVQQGAENFLQWIRLQTGQG